jgi:hypothetical protein
LYDDVILSEAKDLMLRFFVAPLLRMTGHNDGDPRYRGFFIALID